MKILNVNARYPGSTHDSYIWKTSLIFFMLEEKSENSQENIGYLLGMYIIHLKIISSFKYCKTVCLFLPRRFGLSATTMVDDTYQKSTFGRRKTIQ